MDDSKEKKFELGDKEQAIEGGIALVSTFAAAGPYLSVIPDSTIASPIEVGTVTLTAAAAIFMSFRSRGQNKFLSNLKGGLRRIDKEKIDWSMLRDENYVPLLIEAVEAAGRTNSEIRLRLLAQALCNALTIPTSCFSNKDALMVLIGQLSDGEIFILQYISKYDAEWNLGIRKIPRLEASHIALELGWQEEDTLVACQLLQQRNLVNSPPLDESSKVLLGQSLPERGWRLTELGKRIIKLAEEPQQ